MGKTLRVGFAMGGGVSLGTFCGTALSQALKLLIVYGRDRDGQPFDRIVVDVFSGASAGALSLAAMVRGLATPDAEALKQARAAVKEEFGDALDGLSAETLKDLHAAQAVQAFQRKLWSEEIKLDELLGEGGDGQLRYKASLLDRGAVERIAKEFVVDVDSKDFSRRRLLADRVLFACTLTNLTPTVCDASAEFPGKEVGFIGLNDGMRSATHRELRVFDLNLVEVGRPEDPIYPDRWCLYHVEGAEKKMIGDLRKREAWARIAATAIASGSFPGAFEPSVLTRKAFEFGPRIWNRMMGRKPGAKFNGQETIAFSYVDGGTLNNEPIREAFRLASFIDGHDRVDHPEAEFERLVVFVDPNVGESRPSFRVPGHREWTVDEPNMFSALDGYDLRRRSSLERLIPHVFSLLGAITKESGVIEADKVFAMQNAFEIRDHMRRMLFSTLTREPGDGDLQALISFCSRRLKEAETDDMIPPGPMTLQGELERVCHEERNADWADDFGRMLQGKARAFLEAMAKNPAKAEDKDRWLRALAFVAVDLILCLQGKLEGANLVAIAPFTGLREASEERPPQPIRLPGGALSGFAGFMSDVPDALEHAAAKYCAAEFLLACELVDPAMPLPPKTGLTLTDAQQKQFEKDVQLGLNRLAARVGEMVRHTGVLKNIPGINAGAGWLTGWLIGKRVKGIDWRAKQELPCTFRVRVPNESFEFDGREVGDQDARPSRNPIDGQWELVTIASWDGANWAGGFVRENRFDIDQDGSLFKPDKDVCEIALPDVAMMAKAETLPNPTFFLDLTKGPVAKLIAAGKWEMQTGVSPLEETLSK